ncbi:zinc finger protein 862-like [Aphis craccivora]|uniref:Zinc finger protein 862-like n=1 Tax=Aphis craccivora TaxID=307492 RepID=A0A6G0YCF9_APHCR|nr:zinc finger protein 862-like [Aphis craccivora]
MSKLRNRMGQDTLEYCMKISIEGEEDPPQEFLIYFFYLNYKCFTVERNNLTAESTKKVPTASMPTPLNFETLEGLKIFLSCKRILWQKLFHLLHCRFKSTGVRHNLNAD